VQDGRHWHLRCCDKTQHSGWSLSVGHTVAAAAVSVITDPVTAHTAAAVVAAETDPTASVYCVH